MKDFFYAIWYRRVGKNIEEDNILILYSQIKVINSTNRGNLKDGKVGMYLIWY